MLIVSNVVTQAKYDSGEYKTAMEMEADVHLMFDNAVTFNTKKHAIGAFADRMKKSFARLIDQRRNKK